MADLLDTLNLNADRIRELCPSLLTLSKYDTTLGSYDSSVDIDYDNEQLLLYQKQYFEKIEEGNAYLRELKKLEEKYLRAKYGDDIYNDLMKASEEYQKERLDENNEQIYTSEDVKKQYEIFKNLSTQNIQNLKTLDKHVKEAKNQSRLNQRKFMYRSEEIFDINRQTVRATYVYFFFVIAIFIYLFANNILYLKENKMLYISILVFPFVYRFLFFLAVKLYKKLIYNISEQGPKNAFLNENVEPIFLDDDN